MKRTLLGSLLLLGVVAFAQARPPVTARDAGVAKDAGVAAPAKDDTPDRVYRLALDKLRQDLTELKARVTDTEKRLEESESRAAALTKQLDAAQRQLDTLQDAEDRRGEAERAATARKTQTVQANAALVGALQQLSTGATNVEGALRLAESSYSGNAQQLVQLARKAMGNGDLVLARQLLTLAILEAEAATK